MLNGVLDDTKNAGIRLRGEAPGWGMVVVVGGLAGVLAGGFELGL